MSKILKLLYDQNTVKKIKQSHILIVGVGGIGCQLLKNFSKSGYRNFTILDLDSIELTNLNRQFYFRKGHIGLSKAYVGKQCLEKLDPTFNIKAINDNIFSPQYDIEFYQQFDIVVSALDNQKARLHLAEMSLRAEKPFVDAGTQGYSGNCRTIIRGVSSCYECNKEKNIINQKTKFAICTIRNNPQNPVHCIAYATNFYESFFSTEQQLKDSSNALQDEQKLQLYLNKYQNNEQDYLKKIAIEIFNKLFYEKILYKVQQKKQKKYSCSLNPLNYQTAIQMKEIVKNPPSTFNQIQYLSQKQSLYKQDKLWCISQYAYKFIESIINLIKNPNRSHKFQKDDDDCMNLVYCITSLRTYNYIDMHPYNKHKYITFYQVKDIAGNIIPAISSTNAIAAALEVQQIFKIEKQSIQKLKLISISNQNSSDLKNFKIVEGKFRKSNIDCSLCSFFNSDIIVKCNFKTTTFQQFHNLLKEYYSYNRQLIYQDKNGGIKTILSDRREQKQNFQKIIFGMVQYLQQEASHNLINKINNKIQFIYKPVVNHTPLCLKIHLKHDQNYKIIQVINKDTKTKIRHNLTKYLKMKHEKNMNNKMQNFSTFEYL